MLRAAIFDVDGTLYDYQAAHAPAYRALKDYAAQALSLTPERLDALHRDASREIEARAGKNSAVIHNRLIRYQRMLEQIGAPIAHAPRMAEIYWSTLLEAMRPFPGAAEALEQLKSMGLTLGIGTNMTADRQYSKLERLGILPYVDFMVSSEEACVEKPDRRLFDLCAEKAGCAAGECAFVGDSLNGDVFGAVGAGMRAVWFRPEPGPAEAPPGAAVLRAYADLPKMFAPL